MSEFSFEAHERMLADRYIQLARYEAFDKLIDLALDGVITIKDAITTFESEEITYE